MYIIPVLYTYPKILAHDKPIKKTRPKTNYTVQNGAESKLTKLQVKQTTKGKIERHQNLNKESFLSFFYAFSAVNHLSGTRRIVIFFVDRWDFLGSGGVCVVRYFVLNMDGGLVLNEASETS